MLAQGLFLGGAPVNVAQHMAQLGVPTACVSCVGDDVLGARFCRGARSETSLLSLTLNVNGCAPGVQAAGR